MRYAYVSAQGNLLVDQSSDGYQNRLPECSLHQRSRAGSHVVRRFGYFGLVECPLVKRGLRHLLRNSRHRRSIVSHQIYFSSRSSKPYGIYKVEPEWRMEEQFLTYYLHYVFGIDGLETSRPMNTPVVTNDDMSAMFDAISYDKGPRFMVVSLKLYQIYIGGFIFLFSAGCVINMMADFLGEETFRKGLKRYLQAK